MMGVAEGRSREGSEEDGLIMARGLGEGKKQAGPLEYLLCLFEVTRSRTCTQKIPRVEGKLSSLHLLS